MGSFKKRETHKYKEIIDADYYQRLIHLVSSETSKNN